MTSAALVYLAQIAARRAEDFQAGDDQPISDEIAAPGKGWAIVLHSAVVHYSDGNHHDSEVVYTDRDGNLVTLSVDRASQGSADFLPTNRFEEIVTKENTAISISAEAGGNGVVVDFEVTYALVREWALAQVLA